MAKEQQINYETVSIQVPKPVIEFLRFIAKNNNQTVEEQITHDLVDNWKSQLESGMNTDAIIKMLGLEQVFKEYPNC
jgi:hypothetical protein